jgi:hypothetical protein
MVNMANRTNVHMRLRALKLSLRHVNSPSLSMP